jgi:hypothetical protein
MERFTECFGYAESDVTRLMLHAGGVKMAENQNN